MNPTFQTWLGFVGCESGVDAHNKVTLESPRGDAPRLMDIALVEVMGVVLVYVEGSGTVRAISLRRASKLKGNYMKTQSKTDWERVKREAAQ